MIENHVNWMSTLKAHSRIVCGALHKKVEKFNYEQLILKQWRLFACKSRITPTQKITPSTGKRPQLSDNTVDHRGRHHPRRRE